MEEYMLHIVKNMLIKQHAHEIVECLVAALDARDVYTSGHSSRVGDMSFDLAKAMGYKGVELDNLHMAAHLHDIGKLGIPESILFKNGKLLREEYERIQKHPEVGYRILCKSNELNHLAQTVLYHHERIDGKGSLP
jgi:HD-GYP domain-containing protein (c-di-GMP phosphodiesterase class II)